MSRNMWTQKRKQSRKLDELDRHEERRQARKARALEQGSEELSVEDSEHHADEMLSRRVRDKAIVLPEESTGEPGRVVAYRRNTFLVEREDGSTIGCRTRSTTRTPHEDSTLVAVGDQVLFEVLEEKEGVIVEVRPRRNRLSRSSKLHREVEQVMVANIDQILIVASVQEPWLKPGLIDRYLVTAAVNGFDSLLCFNKVDLDPDRHYQEIAELYGGLDVSWCATSAETGEGMDRLRSLLTGRTTVLSGQSGVGKSSLLNALNPDLRLTVRGISQYNSKGTHTTTAARLIRFNFGGHVVDTPGIKELSLWGVSREDVQMGYPEILREADGCRFTNCRHSEEPGCAVADAVEAGRISPLRYQNYLSILESL